MTSPQVLIVGAGPSGLTLALNLAKNNVPIRIIDKIPQPILGQRGGGVQPRTLEMHKFLGTLPRVLEKSVHPYTMQFFAPGNPNPIKEFEIAPLKDSTPARPYPNGRMIWQSRQEEILREEIAKYGYKVEYGIQLESLTQSDESVDVSLLHINNNSTEKASVPYLVSAEGARSVVRKGLDIGFQGETTTQNFVIGDIEVLEGLPNDKWMFWGSPQSKVVSLRASDDPTDKWFNLNGGGPEMDFKKASESREGFIEAFYNTSKRTDVKFGKLLWISHYNPNIRMVDSFGKGRCFLVGDAAHVHSPTGGQGMNSGVQDSMNLGWKLALVLKGAAPPSVLESYDAERKPVISAMLKKTTGLLKETVQMDPKNPSFSRGGSLDMLGINYQGSPIVLDEIHPQVASSKLEADSYVSGEEIHGGDRAPDASGLSTVPGGNKTTLFDLFKVSNHTMLVFSTEASDPSAAVGAVANLSELVKSVVVLPREAADVNGIKDANYIVNDSEGHAAKAYLGENVTRPLTVVIVRPDGYVGAMVDSVEGVKRYFKKIFV